MPVRVETLRRNAVETGLAERIAPGQRGVVGRGECIRRSFTDEREAPEASAEPAFLVEPGRHIDSAILRRRRLGQRPGDFEPVDDAHRTVKPASGRLGIGVGADDHRLSGIAGSADDVTGAVDSGIESGLGESAAEPVSGFDVDRRERGPHHTAPAGPELSQAFQIGDQPLAVDGHFDCAHVRSPPAVRINDAPILVKHRLGPTRHVAPFPGARASCPLEQSRAFGPLRARCPRSQDTSRETWLNRQDGGASRILARLRRQAGACRSRHSLGPCRVHARHRHVAAGG